MTATDWTYQLTALKDRLFRFARRIVGDAELAEDVVQEVVIKVWTGHNEQQPYQNLEAYCMRLTKNLSIDKTRSKHFRHASMDQVVEVPHTRQTPYDQTEQQDLLEHVERLMQQLPQQQQLVLQLRDVEGMSYQEIGEALDLSPSAVKVTLHRARKTLRAQLMKLQAYGLSND